MSLTLVAGPANSAKAGEVLGAYAAAVARGAMLVVPTAQDARHYERELVADGVVLGAVLTFDGLVGVVAQRAGYAGRRLSGLQRERVLAGVLARLDLDALRASARGAGFEVAAGELIAELQRSLVTPQRFAAALRAWAAQDVRRASFTRDVGRIYGEYVRELDRLGRVDRELFAWRALDALRADPGRWSTPTPDGVFVYGFDDLTALERDAVETLARIPGVAVTVSLTYEPGRAALVARAESVEELRPLADTVLELPARDEHYAPGSREILHRLERGLFEPAAARFPGRGVGAAGPDDVGRMGSPREPAAPPERVVTLLEAGGERAEAELVAAEIVDLLDAGMVGEEIVVVHRSVARASGLLRRVFAAYGIPLAARRETALAHTALGRALLGAARCALLGDTPSGAQAKASPADLLAYLRAPGLLRDPDVADGLEAEIRREGLTTVAQARERLGWELGELDSLAAAARSGAGAPGVGEELCRMARRLLAAPHRGGAAQLREDEELDARAVAALTRGLDELAQLPGAPRRGLGSAAALIELVGSLPVGGAAAPAPGEVMLAEPAQIRARRFRAVFVCGLQEGEFPGPAAPEPFFSDERRRELALASGLRLRAHEDALDAERYLFYAAVSRATERVFLSYRSSDEEGNLALPSPFIADVAELLGDGWRERRRRRLLADVTWPVERAPTERERVRAQAAARAPAEGDERATRRVLGPRALASVRHSRILSAGALETYADCPVKWLIERELRPQPLVPESDPITRGNLMHSVLERLLAQLGEPIGPDSLGRAREILDRLVAELADEVGAGLGLGGPAVVRAGALRAIEADLRRYLEHEAQTGARWRPLRLEWRFGFEPDAESGSEAGLPALALGDGPEPVLVRGMIDRVDVEDPSGSGFGFGFGSGGGARRAIVRDYKSGATRDDQPVARWGPERRLQVALYMLVVRDLAGLDPVAGFYQPLRGESIRARGVYRTDPGLDVGSAVVSTDGRDGAELDAELAAAAQRAVELATALRAGELTPCPQTCSRDGCSHPSICRSR